MTDSEPKTPSMSDETKKPPTNRRSYSSQTTSPNLKKSPSSWLKSKLICYETWTRTQRIRPVAGVEHRRNRSSGGFIISRNRRHGRHSADFSYDPLSYALNFQQEDESLTVDNFISRLPVSPKTNLEDLKGKIEAVQIRTSTATATEKSTPTGRPSNNIFEVTVPRLKTVAPPVETSSRPPVVSGSESHHLGRRWCQGQKAISWCKHFDNRWAI
ncbi:hypothetical protein L2E82_49227 [Cichorium intybus]|uniref:Uncharacterized protein n=1 Tax=Cichorium intybus TaxID=13427 RepID=A0ACB8Z0B8_CICIN|nr:hypothetical protein L2E82_49227 [Cichorium intybus]